MKITRRRLRRIINEAILNESTVSDDVYNHAMKLGGDERHSFVAHAEPGVLDGLMKKYPDSITDVVNSMIMLIWLPEFRKNKAHMDIAEGGTWEQGIFTMNNQQEAMVVNAFRKLDGTEKILQALGDPFASARAARASGDTGSIPDISPLPPRSMMPKAIDTGDTGDTGTNENKMTEQKIRKEINSLITEIKEEQHQEDMAIISELMKKRKQNITESKQLSEVRKHVRSAINEMMIGLTPITRMNTQGNAKNARKGNATNTGIDKAEIGFNTFDMQEWASIAGITENTGLTEHWEDDGYGGNVVDIRDPGADEASELPGMETLDTSYDPGPLSGDTGCGSEVSDIELDFTKFLDGLKAQDAAGVVRIGDAAVEGDEHYRDEYADDEFSFTGDVGELPGDDAFAIGLEAGKRGLDDDEPRG